jgi:insecticidal toxin complex protein TccC
VFDEHFDAHGNQLKLQPGTLPLLWNSRDQLAVACLVERGNAPNDEETYTYSQGVRVEKKLITQAQSVNHTRTVRYLHGLEIRTLDTSEALHVIILPGNIRCLHWVTGQPAGIDNDQLRYSLDDHLGSCTLELDGEGVLISLEFYYPFGGTCWWAARSVLEASYKTVRYSGKEMDVSGLYYYGARYYAPWLQRWISADPLGDVDGLNLYTMVANNPVLYIDKTGGKKAIFEVAKNIVGWLDKAKTAADQLHNLTTEFDGLIPEGADIDEIRQSMTFGKFIKSRHGVKSILKGAIAGATVASAIGSIVPGVGTGIGAGVGILVGAIAMPLLRYYAFKKGLKLAQTLRTQELKDGLNTAANATTKIVDGAQSLLNGGHDVLDKIKNAADNISAYPARLQDMFYTQLETLAGDKQREVMNRLKTGIDPFEAIDQVLATAQTAIDTPSEAEGVTARLTQLTQLAQEVTGETLQKPIPKPRTRLNLNRRQSVAESSA